MDRDDQGVQGTSRTSAEQKTERIHLELVSYVLLVMNVTFISGNSFFFIISCPSVHVCTDKRTHIYTYK